MGNKVGDFRILPEGKYATADVESLKQEFPDFKLVDLYDDQLKELFELTYPPEADRQQAYSQFKSVHSSNPKTSGTWVVYPWLRKILHILNEDDFFKVRTNRNKNLLTTEEIDRLQNYTVGVAGLSVGNSIARAMVYSASCGEIVLADKDVFSLSNMNRVSIGVADLGELKLDVTVRQLYEANPYVRVRGMPEGLSVGNLDEFFMGEPFIAFDEMDDFEMKIRLRIAAQKKKAAVVMLTNLGDNILIDIERHDKQEIEPFHGRAGTAISDIMAGKLSEDDKKRYAAQLVGVENVPTRALYSMGEMGKTLVGRPQLFGSISVSAGLSSFVVRQIALDDLSSGRYLFAVRDIFKLNRSDLVMDESRQQILNKLAIGA